MLNGKIRPQRTMSRRAAGATPINPPFAIERNRVEYESAQNCATPSRRGEGGGRSLAGSGTRAAHESPEILVPLAGLEPARPCGHLILSQARLPIPPQGQARGPYWRGRRRVNDC